MSTKTGMQLLFVTIMAVAFTIAEAGENRRGPGYIPEPDDDAAFDYHEIVISDTAETSGSSTSVLYVFFDDYWLSLKNTVEEIGEKLSNLIDEVATAMVAQAADDDYKGWAMCLWNGRWEMWGSTVIGLNGRRIGDSYWGGNSYVVIWYSYFVFCCDRCGAVSYPYFVYAPTQYVAPDGEGEPTAWMVPTTHSSPIPASLPTLLQLFGNYIASKLQWLINEWVFTHLPVQFVHDANGLYRDPGGQPAADFDWDAVEPHVCPN